jgi:hypothetical protein
VSQDGLKSEHEEEAMQAHLEDVGSGLAPVSAAWFVVNVAAWLTSTGSPTSAPTKGCARRSLRRFAALRASRTTTRRDGVSS